MNRRDPDDPFKIPTWFAIWWVVLAIGSFIVAGVAIWAIVELVLWLTHR